MPERASVAIVGSGNISSDLLFKLMRREWSSRGRWSGSTRTPTVRPAPASSGSRRAPEASSGCSRRTSSRTSCSRATSASAHADAPRSRGGGDPGGRSDAGRRRPLRRPGGQPRRAPRGAEREHGHVRRPGDHPDRRRGVAGRAPWPTRKSSPRCCRARPAPGHARQHRRVHAHDLAQAYRDRSGARNRGKAIIILNPADPPLIMRDTIFCASREETDHDAMRASVAATRRGGAGYVPGYRMTADPQFDDRRPESGTATGAWPCFSRSRAPGTTCRPTRETSTS